MLKHLVYPGLILWDREPIGELESKMFNAAKRGNNVKGKSVHPGYAKNKWLNASLLLMKFIALYQIEVP